MPKFITRYFFFPPEAITATPGAAERDSPFELNITDFGNAFRSLCTPVIGPSFQRASIA